MDNFKSVDVKVEETKPDISVPNLEDIKPIENQGIDLWKFDKKETKIASAIISQVKSQYTETEFQWVLKVEGEVLEVLKTEEAEISFKASELFNLIQDKSGKLVGYPTGESSNLMKFLKDIGVKDVDKFSSLKELIEEIKGKAVLIKAYDKDYQGGNRTYLKFRY